MFDDVTCEYPLPDGREVAGRAFQTNSLWCCMDRFTVTAAGRLIFHQSLSPPPEPRRTQLGSPWHASDIDLNYHGDLDLHGIDAAGQAARYVVRFTHGSVEWVRPYDARSAVCHAWRHPGR